MNKPQIKVNPLFFIALLLGFFAVYGFIMVVGSVSLNEATGVPTFVFVILWIVCTFNFQEHRVPAYIALPVTLAYAVAILFQGSPWQQVAISGVLLYAATRKILAQTRKANNED